MKAKVSYSGGSNETPVSRRAEPRASMIDRGARVSPTPRAARSSAAVMYSTSISGSSFTPARWARSASWRRVGSSEPKRAS